MKYIRTKDGIKRVFRKLKDGFYLVKASRYRYYHYYPDCKVADTIEELCDEVVYVSKGQNIPDKSFPPLFNIKQINELCSALHTGGKYDLDNFYYGIWTDKGLIYVAKMNEKGDLELL